MFNGASAPPANYYNYPGTGTDPYQQSSAQQPPSKASGGYSNAGQYAAPGYQSTGSVPPSAGSVSGNNQPPVPRNYGPVPPSATRTPAPVAPASSGAYGSYGSGGSAASGYPGYGGAPPPPPVPPAPSSAAAQPASASVDNEAVYVTDIPLDATEVELAQFFARAGTIKFDPVTCQPAVTIYRDKRTGRAKGDALIVFENINSAQCAVQWMHGTQLRGQTLHVEGARKPKEYPSMKPAGGGYSSGPPSQGYGGPPQSRGPPSSYGPPPGASSGSYYGQGPPHSYGGAPRDGWSSRDNDRSDRNDRNDRDGDGGGFRGRGGRGGRGGGGAPGDLKPGDWACTQCGNNNFKFRNECNRCKTPKSSSANVVGGNDGGGYDDRGGDRGSDRSGRGGYRGGDRDGQGRGGGPMRGRGRGDARPRPY